MEEIESESNTKFASVKGRGLQQACTLLNLLALVGEAATSLQP